VSLVPGETGGRRGRLERVPEHVLLVLVVGLAVHNLAMALLWQAGVRGAALDVVAAWKDVLLVGGVVCGLVALRSRPRILWADRLALAYAAFVVVYFVLPQGWLGGGATPRGEILALRHHLLPVGAYLLGRLVVLTVPAWRRIGPALFAVAGMLAVWGLVDVYLVPLDTWRDSGVPGWFREQLTIRYVDCFGGLPENWIFNTNDETNPIRRLTATFLSPLATAFALCVVLLLIVARRRRDSVTVVVGLVAGAGLLWTHTRAALIAFALGLVVLAVLQRRPRLVLLAVVWVALSYGFVKAFPTIGPATSYTAGEIECLRANAARTAETSGDALSGGDASIRSHLRNLGDGIRTVLDRPLGYGLGNAGVTASRTGVEIKAGESTYTEIGVDMGIAGAVALVAWLGALAAALGRRSAWLAASLISFAALGLQTDVIGVHWLVVVVFSLAGAVLSRARAAPPPEAEV
jgi:O-Antigen ligase